MDTRADLPTFFADFAERVSTPVGTLLGIFDEQHAGVLEEPEVDSVAPMLTCRTDDLARLRVGHGSVLTLRGMSYIVRSVQPDGTGVTVLRLQEA